MPAESQPAMSQLQFICTTQSHPYSWNYCVAGRSPRRIFHSARAVSWTLFRPRTFYEGRAICAVLWQLLLFVF